MPDLHEVDELVIDVGAARQEEARTRREVVEEEKLLLLANEAMVALGGQLLLLLPRFVGLLRGERYAVDALQGVARAVPQEIGAAALEPSASAASEK